MFRSIEPLQHNLGGRLVLFSFCTLLLFLSATSSAVSQNSWHFSLERHSAISSFNVSMSSTASVRSFVGFRSMSEANFAFSKICFMANRYRTKFRLICSLKPLASVVRSESLSLSMMSCKTSMTISKRCHNTLKKDLRPTILIRI